MAKSRAFTVRGQKVRTTSPRRYVVVAVRPADVTARAWDYRTESYGEPETYAAFARVVKRTDSHKAAAAAVRRYGRGVGSFAVVVDAWTGEEVAV